MPSAFGGSVVHITGNRGLERLYRALEDEGRGRFRRNTVESIRRQSRTTIGDVRRAVLAVPARGVPGGGPAQRLSQGKMPGLRDAIAGGLENQITTMGVRIHVRESALPKDQWTLPKYLDGELAGYRRWRHPYFGDRSRWVQQHNQHRWFFVTIDNHTERYEQALNRVIERRLERIARAA